MDFVLGFAAKLCPDAPLKDIHLSSHFSKSVFFKASKDTLVACNVLNTSQDDASGAERKVVAKNSPKSFILEVFSASGKHHSLACLVFLSRH